MLYTPLSPSPPAVLLAIGIAPPIYNQNRYLGSIVIAWALHEENKSEMKPQELAAHETRVLISTTLL